MHINSAGTGTNLSQDDHAHASRESQSTKCQSPNLLGLAQKSIEGFKFPEYVYKCIFFVVENRSYADYFPPGKLILICI